MDIRVSQTTSQFLQTQAHTGCQLVGQQEGQCTWLQDGTSDMHTCKLYCTVNYSNKTDCFCLPVIQEKAGDLVHIPSELR